MHIIQIGTNTNSSIILTYLTSYISTGIMSLYNVPLTIYYRQGHALTPHRPMFTSFV